MLTREQIEVMTGNEVDAYLAENVMEMSADSVLLCIFTPHANLNHAIEAAEKVGLVIERTRLQPENPDVVVPSIIYNLYFYIDYRADGWHSGWGDYIRVNDIYNGVASTPALSVCRAVIAANEASLL